MIVVTTRALGGTGSARVIGSVGDERNSLIMLTVQAALGPGGATVTLPAALALLDEDNKILDEQVVFFAVPN